MAAKSTLRNMVLCLTLICLVCSAILAVVYAVTYDPIKAAEKKALVESLEMVLPQGGEISEAQSIEFGGAEYEYYVKSENGEPVAWAIKSSTVGFGGTLTLMVGVQRGSVVYATKVLAHSETPGLGAKITDENIQPRAQVKGRNPMTDAISVKKDGGEIDAITASTITSRAFLKGVNMAYEVFKQVSAPAASEQPAEEPLNTLSDEQQQ